MPEYFTTPALLATFRSDRATKLDLTRGATMLVGLNCFEPGQSQSVHSHGGADKFYFIISGNARMRVGDAVQDAGPGTMVWAPAGVPHGVEQAHERTVMLVGIAPPPPG
jgi:mannose-6-phosphate isomerase-like protein (cupin superfamily)